MATLIKPSAMDDLYNTHVKLLASDLLKLTPSPSRNDSSAFLRRGKRLSRAETVGIVVTRDLKPGKFVKFSVDDGFGCITCILWTNQLTSAYFSRRNPSGVRLIAEVANDFASRVQLGVLVRVRGRITGYRGNIQITVTDVVVERDPNMQILHWLDCVRLARKCYN
ncbi:OLC1v1007229C2 [Oldenlandia corymbosa var. corymbosa]|uniref:CST complex subunit STN1 n=1 Tax=Oldenlandia corymbosa var. corymbosa TaxID=529605 RepID=A0AAV1DM62_OLDCO|nr:OLC1v1007229C2 [Oldenlandia corymbosa var. corymbosa]